MTKKTHKIEPSKVEPCEVEHHSEHRSSGKILCNKVKAGIMVFAVAVLLFVGIGFLNQKDVVTEDELAAHTELLAEEQGLDPEAAKEVAGKASGIFSRSSIKYIGCKETDAGDDPKNAGNLSVIFNNNGNLETRDYSDTCSIDGQKLKEYYCSGKRHATATHTCPCIGGKCVPVVPTVVTCTPESCNDYNECTYDRCNLETGNCDHTPVPDGTVCNKDVKCVTAGNCTKGQCAGSIKLTPPDC